MYVEDEKYHERAHYKFVKTRRTLEQKVSLNIWKKKKKTNPQKTMQMVGGSQDERQSEPQKSNSVGNE